jgi:hypothetical protein
MAGKGKVMAEPTIAEQYRLKEFEKLRSEIETTLNAAWSNERYGVIACGAVWSWLITQHIHLMLPWTLPLIIVIAGWGRNASLFLHLLIMGEYMRVVEREVLSPSGGWDVYFDKRRNETVTYWLRFVGDNMVWGVLLVAGAAAMVFKRYLLQ